MLVLRMFMLDPESLEILDELKKNPTCTEPK